MQPSAKTTTVLFLALVLPTALVAQTALGIEIPTNGYFWDFLVSSDGTRVVYDANIEDSSIQDLYSIQATGSGSNTRLNGATRTSRWGINDFAISDDDQWVVYTSDEDIDGDYELFSVPIDGGTSNKLNVALSASQDISSFEIATGSDSVVYRGDQDTNDVFELYSAPIDGSATAIQLNASLDPSADVDKFEVSPDGSTVVYIADQDVVGEKEVYSISITGGTSTQLNDPLVSGGSTSSLMISPNGDSVVWVGDHDTDDQFEIYAAPIGGGSVVKLNDALPAAGDVVSTNFQMVYDGNTTWVVYQADRDTDNQNEIYSVSITGGTVTELNGTLVSSGRIRQMQLSPDGSTVVYSADQDVLNKIELYSVPIDGGTAVKINSTSMVAGGDIYGTGSRFAINSLSDRVVYMADQDIDNVTEIYSSPIGGGGPTKLNVVRSSGFGVRKFEISPNGTMVAYRGEMNGNTIYELYEVDITGGTPNKVHSDLSGGADVDDFLYSPTGNIIFTADIAGDTYDELYAVDAVVLPVELVEFGGKRTGPGQVSLSWATAQEIDNEGFVVEMSPDGENYREIGFVAGAGTSEIALHYLFEAYVSEAAYFRLRQEDFDGEFAFSPTIYIEGSDQMFRMRIGPNPVTGPINVFTNRDTGASDLYSVQLTDPSGKVLLYTTTGMTEMPFTLDRALAGLPAGIYSVQVSSGDQTHFQRLIVQ